MHFVAFLVSNITTQGYLERLFEAGHTAGFFSWVNLLCLRFKKRISIYKSDIELIFLKNQFCIIFTDTNSNKNSLHSLNMHLKSTIWIIMF